MNTTILDPAQVERLVDGNDLVCARCHEHVRAGRPTAHPALGAEFAHSDGSALCTDRSGRACEPI
jgi:hypothetical protein